MICLLMLNDEQVWQCRQGLEPVNHTLERRVTRCEAPLEEAHFASAQ
jgi:hypothetical protein